MTYLYGSVGCFCVFLFEYHFNLLLMFPSFVCTLFHPLLRRFRSFWEIFSVNNEQLLVMQRIRWLCVFLSLCFPHTLWNGDLCFFCLPDCLIAPTRASGTGSSWRFTAGVRGRRARGRWRFQTRRLSCVTLRCWVSFRRPEVSVQWCQSCPD